MLKASILIRPGTGHDPRWLSVDEHGAPAGGVQTGLPSAADIQGKRLVALAPGRRVLLTAVNMPTRKRARLLQALPFAVEEQLAFDVETQHVAAGAQASSGDVAVAVAAREEMQAWLAALSEAGLKPDAVIPEPSCLPDPPCVLLEDDLATVNLGQTGFACDPAHLAVYWSHLASAPEAVNVYDLRRDPAAPVALNTTAMHAQRQGPALTLFAAGLKEASVNLLQGEFEPRRHTRTGMRLWRAAAILAAVWLLATLAFGVTDYVLLRAQAARLHTQIRASFERLLPGSPLVNARVQIEQALAERGLDEAELLQLIAVVGSALEQHPDFRVEALQYRDRALTLHLKGPSIAALDRLRTALRAGGTVHVELESATATAEGVDGRLRISESAG